MALEILERIRLNRRLKQALYILSGSILIYLTWWFYRAVPWQGIYNKNLGKHIGLEVQLLSS